MNRTDTLDVLSRKLAPFVMMFGLYLVAYGHVSPGGGFQGGVVLASGAVLLLLGARPDRVASLFPPRAMRVAEAGGFLAFLVVGAAGLLFARAYLANFLPTRSTGGVLDAPLLLLLNAAIGIEVGAGITLICSFLFRGVEE